MNNNYPQPYLVSNVILGFFSGIFFVIKALIVITGFIAFFVGCAMFAYYSILFTLWLHDQIPHGHYHKVSAHSKQVRIIKI